ncbi:MAG: ABC transporter permease [Bacteroidota bacterium]
MTTKENLFISIQAIKSQKLRASLTIFIIALGIMALVGTLTAIDAVKYSLNNSFSMMGSNSVTIRNVSSAIRMGHGPGKRNVFPPITIYQANSFKETFDSPGIVAISVSVTPVGSVRYESKKTNPNILVMGVDENYFEVVGYQINSGRNFNKQELELGSNVCVLGKEITDKLFINESAADKLVYIGSKQYRVIGTLQEKGSSMGFGGDKMVAIPVLNAKMNYLSNNTSYAITIKAKSVSDLLVVNGQATGLMRTIRKDRLGNPDSFGVSQSDSLSKALFDNLIYLRAAAVFIGIITLLGAAIGLMNIMLVSVTERTREIGIRKSLGATAQNIRQQFLTEAIVICQIGGLLGVLLGIIIGNVVAFATGAGVIIPWAWMLMGFSLCFIVGISSGIYPAIKASKLDPIEALRYE